MKPLLRVGLPVLLLLALGWWLTRAPLRTSARPSTTATEWTPPVEPDSASWESAPTMLRLADDHEPGTPLVIFGYVFTAEGQPASNVRMVVYQADAKGEYGKSAREPSWARLSGQLRTDSLGRYQVHTVRPGSYGGPAHVHFMVGGGAWAASQAFELRFADDPANGGSVLPGLAADTGAFATVRAVVRDQGGVLRVRRDFRLK